MPYLSANILLITLNVNGLNISIKGQNISIKGQRLFSRLNKMIQLYAAYKKLTDAEDIGDRSRRFDPWVRKHSWRSWSPGNRNLLQYFCLGNPTDRGAW